MSKFSDGLAESLSKEADDLLKRWLQALNVGNGAALLGTLTIMGQPNRPEMIYLLLPSAWIFLGGVISGILAVVCLAGAHRQNEIYWRYSNANDADREAGKPLSFSEEIINRADRWGDNGGMAAVGFSLLSSILFVSGIALPLGHLTARAAAGTL